MHFLWPFVRDRKPASPRTWRWWAARVGARAVLIVVLLCAATVVRFSFLITDVGHEAEQAGPAEVARGFESFEAISEGGVTLRGWHAPGPAGRPVVVLCHGWGDSRRGIVDAAALALKADCGAVLFDFRGHGASGRAPCTLGAHETADVRAVLHWLHRRGLDSGGVILWGFSMGAVAAIRAAEGEPAVRAVVAESPFDNLRSTLAHHAWLWYRIPAFPLVPLTVALTEWRAGFDADDVDAAAGAARLRPPTKLLLVRCEGDARATHAMARRILDAAACPAALWEPSGKGHLGARSAEGEAYVRRLRALADGEDSWR
jgi:pimeloyl-ACP methyl ester carboxylesterase